MIRRAALLLLALLPVAQAHRLDEYLQATLLGVGPDGIRIELMLTPGVAVLPSVLPLLDRNQDNRISPEEEQAYAEWVMKDLELRVDGSAVRLRPAERKFPSVGEMRDGLGSIRLIFASNRTGADIRFTNRHLPELSAYLVNCLAPTTPGVTLGPPDRDPLQKSIHFTAAVPRPKGRIWSLVVVSLLASSVAVLSRRRKPTCCQ